MGFSGPGNEIHHARVDRNGGLGTGFAAGGDGTSSATAMSSGSAALRLLRWADEITTRYGRNAARVDAFKKAAQYTRRRPAWWEPQPFGAGILDVGIRTALNSRSLTPIPR